MIRRSSIPASSELESFLMHIPFRGQWRVLWRNWLHLCSQAHWLLLIILLLIEVFLSGPCTLGLVWLIKKARHPKPVSHCCNQGETVNILPSCTPSSSTIPYVYRHKSNAWLHLNAVLEAIKPRSQLAVDTGKHKPISATLEVCV